MRSWTGWYDERGSRHPITFDEVLFIEEERNYQCKGFDDAGHFSMKAFFNGNAFRAEQKFSTWTILYEGRVVGGQIDGNGRSVGSKVNGQWYSSTNRNYCDAFEIST